MNTATVTIALDSRKHLEQGTDQHFSWIYFILEIQL